MSDWRPSCAALDRMAEVRAREDPRYQAKLQAANRALLRDARALDDDELQARLADIHGPVVRAQFAELTREHDSAESVADEILAKRDRRPDAEAGDWLWLVLAVLWERWQPDRPSFEMLDAWMQQGYDLEGEDRFTDACDLWQRAWRAFMNICETRGIDSVRELDRRFRGTQSMFNWMQDLEMNLWNAGIDDARYQQVRVDLCREMVARFRDLDPTTLSNTRCAIAESLAMLGEAEAADAEFDSLVRANPADGSLWSRWARSFDRHDMAKALAILERGLATSGLRDRKELLEDALYLGEKAGRDDLVERARRELESPPAPAPAVQRPAVQRAEKVGRNDPCPCGSGKKYKKCCLGKATA